MKLKELYNPEKFIFSLEIFPPKGEDEELEIKINELFNELKTLSQYDVSFISVTYGAGGGTREKTFDIVMKIKNDLRIIPIPHFTCVGSTREEIREYIKKIESQGIENIMALRGDPPKGNENFIKPEGGFGYANELVEFIKQNTNLGIAVAGYPECHRDCCSIDTDIVNLKRKVDAGADVVVTQLFYDNNCYFQYVERALKAGINIPVVPGILPITGLSQIEKISSLCKCTLPEKLVQKMKNHQHDKEAVRNLGIEYAINQCGELLDNKVPGLHFYTLNKAGATVEILQNLAIKVC